MRNLKKLLALVLAMVMAFSLMLSASAADVKFEDYQDKDSITAEFVEGVQVLTGLKVFQGDENGFRPSDTITRAEAAAIIYRMATGDVDNRQNDLYKDYGTFTDVNSGDWFAGYVGYCQNAGYIKGTTPTTFNPYGKVTGYEALAMILRVVGYGKNNEFTGSQWQVNVAALSRQLGVTKNVTAAHMDQTLNMAAPREVVADLIFMTATIVPTVTYTPALAYNDKTALLETEFNPTLGQQTFGLWYETSWTESDEWGRPGYSWYQNGARAGLTNANTGKAYMVKDNHPVYFGTRTGNLVATIMAVPGYETKEQVRECDVAHELGITNTQNFDLYVNSDTVTAADYQIVATDTVTKVGGQGRVTEFYYKIESPWFADTDDDYAVMIDTMLALITGKRDAKLDRNDHVITPAQLDVVIYDGATKVSSTSAGTSRIISKATSSKDNWEYEVGDFILINAYTAQGTPNVHTATVADREKAAFETNQVVAGTTGYPANTLVAGGSTQNVWVLQKPDVKQGKQTVTYWNQGKHNVDGTDTPDQLTLYLDVAGSTTNTTYNWYFDLYGNIIGIGPAKGSQFGVITAIYAANNQGDSATVGTTKAIATVRYADGSTGTVEIDRFLMSNSQTNTMADPGARVAAGTQQLSKSQYTIDLRPQYNIENTNPMSASAAWVPVTAKGAPVAGYVYMSTDKSRNSDGHFYANAYDGTGANTTDNYNILWDNLFMFTTASDDAVVAVEVAGHVTSANSDSWVNLHNSTAGTTGDGGMIFKNTSYAALDVTTVANAGTTGTGYVNAAGSTLVYLDNDTKIMVRTGRTSRDTAIVTYDGVDALPGNVKITDGTEVDWADTDNDGRADYLYVDGSLDGVITYGLFYYNGYPEAGCEAKWDGSQGTVTGYMNGKAETLTFNNRSLFDDVVNSAGYDAHLFALQITSGVVTNILHNAVAGVGGSDTNNQLLYHYTNGDNSTGNAVTLSAVNVLSTSPSIAWVNGPAGGNSYTATTTAAYYKDLSSGAAGTTNLTYYYDNNTNGGRTIDVSVGGAPAAATFWLTPNCNIIGELEWLNQRDCDVTIVYENNATSDPRAVSTIYITPDPDWTPETRVGTITPNTMAYNNAVGMFQLNMTSNVALTAGLDYEINIYDPATGLLVATKSGNDAGAQVASTAFDIFVAYPTIASTGRYYVEVTFENASNVTIAEGAGFVVVR